MLCVLLSDACDDPAKLFTWSELQEGKIAFLCGIVIFKEWIERNMGSLGWGGRLRKSQLLWWSFELKKNKEEEN